MSVEIYADPDVYCALSEQSRAHDIPFYVGLVAARGARSVLEYGVGAGRVALPIVRASADVRVVGVDVSPAMLARLGRAALLEPAEVRERLTWRCADACEVSLGERVDLAIFPFNGLAELLTDERLARFFARVREHLAPGGALAFDVLVPDRALYGVQSSTPWMRHPRTGQVSRCTQSIAYDAQARVATTTTEIRAMASDAPPERFVLSQKQLAPRDVRELLATHGFELEWETATASLPGDLREGLATDAVAFVARPSTKLRDA